MGHLFLLAGPPGSGKRTVGKELARLTGAALLDNHLCNDPVFAAFGLDGLRPVPAEAWPFVGRIREVLLEATRAAPREVSHIFTGYFADLPGEADSLGGFRDLAAARGATFVPVWLSCPLPELQRRVTLPERRERLKLRNPALLRELVERSGVLPPPRGALVIDTSKIAPADAALLIASHAGALF